MEAERVTGTIQHGHILVENEGHSLTRFEGQTVEIIIIPKMETPSEKKLDLSLFPKHHLGAMGSLRREDLYGDDGR